MLELTEATELNDDYSIPRKYRSWHKKTYKIRIHKFGKKGKKRTITFPVNVEISFDFHVFDRCSIYIPYFDIQLQSEGNYNDIIEAVTSLFVFYFKMREKYE